MAIIMNVGYQWSTPVCVLLLTKGLLSASKISSWCPGPSSLQSVICWQILNERGKFGQMPTQSLLTYNITPRTFCLKLFSISCHRIKSNFFTYIWKITLCQPTKSFVFLNIKGSLKMCFQLPLAIVICATEFLCESLSLFACFRSRLHLRPAPGLYHTVQMVLVDPCDNLRPAPGIQRNLPQICLRGCRCSLKRKQMCPSMRRSLVTGD